MKYSIIVPIYDVEKYIHKCLESIINQTYNDIEIILVDDESPDNCPEICDKFEQKDKRIKVIHKKNGGLSDARNAGLKIATGDYVLFVDSDDYIDTKTCENFLIYTNSNADVIIGNAIVEKENISFMDHILCSDIMTGKEYLLKAYKNGKAPMAAWLNLYRREFLIDNNLYFKYGILHEDEQFTPRVLLKANTVIVTQNNFYHYVIRNNSITTKIDKRKNASNLYDTCEELLEIYNVIEDNELKDYLIDSLVEKYLNMFQIGKLYQYGNKYLHKEFIKKNAKLMRTKKKAKLYSFSPLLYYWINYISKLIRG